MANLEDENLMNHQSRVAANVELIKNSEHIHTVDAQNEAVVSETRSFLTLTRALEIIEENNAKLLKEAANKKTDFIAIQKYSTRQKIKSLVRKSTVVRNGFQC